MARPGDLARAIELTGPWQHRYVAANGARFHVVEATGEHGPDAPLVLLLHGFPEFWWAWRAQLVALAAAGYRAVAMDLRGYGGSDKTPRGYDPLTLAGDVSGVIKALGERNAVLVGHGWGGYIAWTTAVVHHREVTAVGAVSAPHPLVMLDARVSAHHVPALRHVLAMQLPWLPERRLADPASGFLARHLTEWSAGSSTFPTDDDISTYQAAISLWPASHCALEYHRWLVRSRVRADGREFGRRMRAPVEQPVLMVVGADDLAIPADALRRSRRHVDGPVTEHAVPGAGHFVPEEAPVHFSSVLVDWLAKLTRR
jgi:pimeloyl-ACP methyl ester carboxylesterase